MSVLGGFPLACICNVACREILLKNTMASHVSSFDERLCRFQFRADDSEPLHYSVTISLSTRSCLSFTY